MKKVCLTAFLLIVLSAFLTSCGSDEIDEAESAEDMVADMAAIIDISLEDLLERALIRREGIQKPSLEEILVYTQGRTPGPLPYGVWHFQHPRAVSVEEAIEDVNIFFNALYSAYAGYVFFGGDEVFLPVRDDIIASLNELSGMVQHSQIQRMLVDGLSPIITDLHFNIGNTQFDGDMRYFRIVNVYYYRSENGFRNRESGLYLHSIQGHELEDLMRLHLDEQGSLFYRPIVLMDRNYSRDIVFTYEDESYYLHNWQIIGGSRPTRLDYPTLEWVNGIPVIRVMTFGLDNFGIDHAAPFMGFVDEVRDEPVIIMDLRGNIGGNGTFPLLWLHDLLGEIVPSNRILLVSGFESDQNAHRPQPFADLPYEPEIFFGMEYLENGYFISSNHPPRIVESNTLIIFLTDRFTTSTAEGFIDWALSMTNTLVIGNPTAGILAFSGDFGGRLHLPNSGINFGFGRSINLWPDGLFTEGAGIAPDIWVQGDALVAALALLER